MLTQLNSVDPDVVLDWYSDNQDELRACSYTGNGPP